MDGNSRAPDNSPQPTMVCLACGATVSAQARYCGACGADLTAAPTAGAASPSERPVAPPPPAPPPVAPPPVMAQPAPPFSGEGKVCNWCRAVNAPDAVACASCGATFPTPEGDEALERAARERIADMQADINKARGAPWWPFRPR